MLNYHGMIGQAPPKALQLYVFSSFALLALLLDFEVGGAAAQISTNLEVGEGS